LRSARYQAKIEAVESAYGGGLSLTFGEQPAHREVLIATPKNEAQETEPKNRMIERGAEILPQRNRIAGKIGREYQHDHKDQAEATGNPDPYAESESQPNGQLAISNQESYRRGMLQHNLLEDGYKEWIGRTCL